MEVAFSKYHGAGNDFIIIDNRQKQFVATQSVVNELCKQHTGIGADGLILLESDPTNDFSMRYFNSDGSESTMCGNGGRCIAMFARRIGLATSKMCFTGIDGNHNALVIDSETVSLQMKDVEEIEHDDDYFLLDTGSPHYVCFVENVQRVDVATEGRFIRNTFASAKGGVNVNFVQILNEGIKVRTFERGVEAETLSCGTGSVAAAIATEVWFTQGLEEYKIQTLGGLLQVRFQKINQNTFRNIWLTGPVKNVYDGIVNI